MIRLLVDTHVLLWLLLTPDRIPDRTRAQLADPAAAVFVSAASAWEVATKHRLGKLTGAESVVGGYPEHLDRLRATEIPVTSRHALTAGLLSWEHRDPFDRMIVSQSMIESVPLVTADPAVAAFPGVRIVW